MDINCCFSPADILIPDCNLEKWSVIACDQYTSEPEYWEKVRENIGDSPSAYNIILPECYLKEDNSESILKINRTMQEYLDREIFKRYENGIIYVERTQSNGVVRQGIIGKIDLESYDYGKNSKSSVRATEETVISRIPPRVEIRRDAPLEIPHIMLLIDDDKRQIIESLAEKKDSFTKIYDFGLMLNAGSIKGYLLNDEATKELLFRLEMLKNKHDGLLFCVGDGNHSLASAKACYEENKTEASRYALAEVVNIHSDALHFEPIYRVVFDADAKQLINEFKDSLGGDYSGSDAQKFTCVTPAGETEISVKPTFKLSVGTLQSFLDGYVKSHPGVTVDYIHSADSVRKLCKTGNAVGFIFNGMKKDELFSAVKKDGSLPRKTFSMGRADDKRFYLEARIIK